MYTTLTRIGRALRSSSSRPTIPLAIAHDYLTQRGGAERVVLALHRAFPEAPIYTTLYDPDSTYPEFRDARIITSPLNRIPVLRQRHRWALPFLPLAAGLLRVPAETTVVSSSGWAHGFDIAGRSLVYCHSPARWLYLSDQYLGDKASGGITAAVLAALRPSLMRWDRWSVGQRSQPYIANSTVVRRRIAAVYGVDAPIVFPPHSVDRHAPQSPIDGVRWASGTYFLVVSRLLPYKNVHHAIEAVRGTSHRLLVIGAGPLARTLRDKAPVNVRVVGGLDDAQMRWAYENCAAVLAVSYEDFGITPLEGAAFGKPTIALQAGGFLDTIRPGRTGAFIDNPRAEDIRDALDAFQPTDYDAEEIRTHAEGFAHERFVREIKGHLARLADGAGEE